MTTASTSFTAADEAALRRLFLFHGLDEAQIKALLTRCPAAETIEKGATVFNSHEEQPALCVLTAGQALVYRRGDDKRRTLLRQLHTGDIFGAAALYGGFDYVTDVVARTHCRAVFLPQALLSELMRSSPQIAENYIRFLSDRVRFLNAKIAELTAGSAEERLLAKLETMVQEDGSLCIPCSMQSLAQQLSISRSSLYRALDELQRRGALRRDEDGRYFLL